jgi:uncharacterized membrane protein
MKLDMKESLNELSDEDKKKLSILYTIYVLDEVSRLILDEVAAIIILGRFNRSAIKTLAETLETIHSSLIKSDEGGNN